MNDLPSPAAGGASTAAVLHASAVARAQLAHVLRDLGYFVIGEGEGPAGLPIVHVDLVVLDGRVAGLADAVAAIRAAQPAAKILVLAALEEIALVRAAVAAGAHGAIRRPPLRSRVLEALAALEPPPG